MRLHLIFLLLGGIVLIGGCAKKEMEPVPVGEMTEYKDPAIGFSIGHPTGWIPNTQVGVARFYNAQGVEEKFTFPTDPGPIGSMIGVDVTRHPDPAGKIDSIKKELSDMNFQLKPDEPVSVGELSGIKVPYVANFGGGNIINGHRVFFTTDTSLYDLRFAAFGDHYTAYANVFDASLNSLKMPAAKIPGRDETLPSEEMSKYVTDYFSFDYPDNFSFASPSQSGKDLVVELRGIRQDCSIRFDVFGANGNDVDKVFEDNKGSYRATSTRKTTVGGEPAWTLTYNATSQVERRFYFVVKNDKVIRTTLDWYKPQREEYLKAYDKVVSSVRFK